MSTKLIALYREPDDVEAFNRHYEEVHAPLVRKLPHLQQLVINRVTGSPMGKAEYFMIAEMSFAGRSEFDEAMSSVENRAAGKDLMSFARDIAHRVCFLEEGRIIEDAPPAELFTAPKDERTQRFLRRIIAAGRL